MGLDYAKFESDSMKQKPKETLPIYSLDIRANLIRISDDGDIRHSLQPRVMAVHILYEDRDFPLSIQLSQTLIIFSSLIKIDSSAMIDWAIHLNQLWRGRKKDSVQSGKDIFEFTFGQTLHLRMKKSVSQG